MELIGLAERPLARAGIRLIVLYFVEVNLTVFEKIVFYITEPVCDMVLNSDNAIDTIEFTTANVDAALSKLKSNLSNGPDGLPPFMFKRLKHCLAGPLALVFTQLLSVAFVPDAWKKSNNHTCI